MGKTLLTPKQEKLLGVISKDEYITKRFFLLATSFTNVLDAQDEPKFLGNVNWEKVKEYFLSLTKELKNKLVS